MNNPYLKNFRIKVFDIETGGLSPQKSGIISASFIDPDTMELQQLFCEHPSQEGRMVRDILDILSGCDAVVTYNGDSFDFLFLQSRAKQLGAGTSLPDFWSVDLYKWLKKYWSAAKLMEHHRQKDIELALGLSEEIQSSAGGVKLDTMFVDEGFGSLDEESLNQAMNALSKLADGNRLVGIISHVADLKNRIDKQIIVTKEQSGGSKAVIVA